MAKIEATRDYYSLRIFINDILHLEVRMENYDGCQSWYEGSKKKMYFIEIYKKEGQSIVLGYDDFENWKSVLKLIDNNV